jgi:6-phosphogluconolactonase
MTPDVRICADINELSLRAAEAAVRTINESARDSGRCSLVLSGGSTPRTLYGLLASRFEDEIPWARVHLFWGDERYVPLVDSRSNYRMAKETLLDHVPCPPANIHPMPTHVSSPDAAARDYEATLRAFFAGQRPCFDLVLLGLGAEGHTASLFPGSPALAETTHLVRAVSAPADPPTRVTLTWPALAGARNIHVLVAGTDKAHALSNVIGNAPDPQRYPAAIIRSAEGSVIWWVDTEAAAHRPARQRDEAPAGGPRAILQKAPGEGIDDGP